MNSEEKARTLVARLQAVSEAVEAADRSAPDCCADLSAQELKVLCKLERESCCIMTRIAAAIRLSLSSVTALVDRLVERKLVRRDRSPEDRRIVEVALTEEGREVSQAALGGRARAARELMKALTPEEQDRLLALLGKVSGKGL